MSREEHMAREKPFGLSMWTDQTGFLWVIHSTVGGSEDLSEELKCGTVAIGQANLTHPARGLHGCHSSVFGAARGGKA